MKFLATISQTQQIIQFQIFENGSHAVNVDVGDMY